MPRVHRGGGPVLTASEVLGHEAVRKLIAAAQHTIEAVDGLPDWAGEALGESFGALRSGRYALKEALLAAYDAIPPAGLADVPRWIVERPEGSRFDVMDWVRVGDGPAGLATDGTALLVVDDVPDAPTMCSRWSDELAAKTLPKVAAEPDKHPVLGARAGADVLAALDRAEADFEERRGERGWGGRASVLVGDTTLSVELARRWLTPIVRLDPSAPITFAAGGPKAAVRASGPGWRAYLMPLNLTADEVAATIDLLEVPC